MKTNSESRRGLKSPRGNNVQKTFLRSVAVIVSFVLVSYTVSAQDFWKKLLTNSSFNEIAIAMTETSEKRTANSRTSTSSVDFHIEKAEEPILDLEQWMTNESLFGIFNTELENEVEVPLAVENWMLNDNLFNDSDLEEEELQVEAWMVSSGCWEV